MADNNNDDELEIMCPKHNEIFRFNIELEKQKGVLLVDCPYCNIQHKIDFAGESNVEVYRAI